MLPYLVGADVFLVVIGVTKRDLRFVVLEIEGFEDDIDDLHDSDELLFNLILAAEDMRVILSKGTHACESVQLAGLLIAIDGTELRAAERQVFV